MLTAVREYVSVGMKNILPQSQGLGNRMQLTNRRARSISEEWYTRFAHVILRFFSRPLSKLTARSAPSMIFIDPKLPKRSTRR